MLKLITEKLQNQSLEDVNFPAILPKIPFQYQTRSKTRALQQTLLQQDAFLPENVGETLLQGLSTSKQSSLFSSLFVQSASTSTTTTTMSVSSTVSSSSSSSLCSIPVSTVEQFHNALNESLSTTPPAPPKKRHCRSLSAGEVTEGRCRWKPNASKIWRPFRHCRAKHDAYQGHSPMLNVCGFPNHAGGAVSMDSSSSNPSTTLNLAAAGDGAADAVNQYSTPPESPVPRPASATSWESTPNPPVWLEQTAFKPLSSPRLWHRLRSLEDSHKEGLSASSGSVASLTSSVDSAPEVDLTSSGGFSRGTFKRAVVMMPRCRSQPCVSNRKKCGKKRRREEEARPKLDLFKMREESLECLRHPSSDQVKSDAKVEQTRPRRPGCHKYQNKKLLRGTCPPEMFLGLTTIASSPCENNNIPPPPAFQSSSPASPPSSGQPHQQQWSIMITPTSSPTKEMEGVLAGDQKGKEHVKGDICSYCSDEEDNDHHHGEDDGDDDDEESDSETMTDRGGERFVLDPCNELDLEQIEKY